jgi:hypothetical protein
MNTYHLALHDPEPATLGPGRGERPYGGLQLKRTLGDARRPDHLRVLRAQSGGAELVRLVAMDPTPGFRHGVRTGERGEALDRRPQVRRGQVDHQLRTLGEIGDGTAFRAEPQDDGVAESPGGGDRGEVGGAVGVGGGEEGYGGAEVQDAGGYGEMIGAGGSRECRCFVHGTDAGSGHFGDRRSVDEPDWPP